jgi:tRNA A-37 threonylcarbamoyl transferase component Bud32
MMTLYEFIFVKMLMFSYDFGVSNIDLHIEDQIVDVVSLEEVGFN